MPPVIRFPAIAVEAHAGALTEPLQAAKELATQLTSNGPWFVLSGAGCSTASGIPAYRDASGAWQHSQPMTYQAFMGGEQARQRYWARSFQGFSFMDAAQPNAVHVAVRALQAKGIVSTVVTQNVDSLHEKAGTQPTIALHGRLAQVVCTVCGVLSSRAQFQAALRRLNPDLPAPVLVRAPDGDALLEGDFSHFAIPACPLCRGIVKPDVVFFGEGVPRARVEAANEALQQCGGVLVLGSSLTVFSGYRFVRAAHQRGVPILIVNQGATRGDTFASLKVEAECASVLTRAVELLSA